MSINDTFILIFNVLVGISIIEKFQLMKMTSTLVSGKALSSVTPGLQMARVNCYVTEGII